jgi:hypothetical protein
MVNDTIILKVFSYWNDTQILENITLGRRFYNLMGSVLKKKIKDHHKYTSIKDVFSDDSEKTIQEYCKFTFNKKCILCKNKLCYTVENKFCVSNGIISPVCSICTTKLQDSLRSRFHYLYQNMILYNNIQFMTPKLNMCIYASKTRKRDIQDCMFMKCIVCKKIVSTNISKDYLNVDNFYNNLKIASKSIRENEETFGPEYKTCIKTYIEEECLIKHNPWLNYKVIPFRKFAVNNQFNYRCEREQSTFIHTCCLGKYFKVNEPKIRKVHLKSYVPQRYNSRVGIVYKRLETLPFKPLTVNIQYKQEFVIQDRVVNESKELTLFIGKCESCVNRSGICTCTTKNPNINVFWGKKEEYPEYEIFNQLIEDYSGVVDKINDSYHEIAYRINSVDLMQRFVIYNNQTIFLHPDYYD